jgi:translation elongation factor aEF-1 beta
MKVEVIFRILPKDSEVDIERLKEKIEKEIMPEKIDVEPIAFGLNAIKISKVIDEEKGKLEELESKIKNIEEIGEYDIISMTRLFG